MEKWQILSLSWSLEANLITLVMLPLIEKKKFRIFVVLGCECM